MVSAAGSPAALLPFAPCAIRSIAPVPHRIRTGKDIRRESGRQTPSVAAVLIRRARAAQTIQYVQPQHASAARLGQAELLVVDEAAAIPLPAVRAMLGPYLVCLASTVNGCALLSASLAASSLTSLFETLLLCPPLCGPRPCTSMRPCRRLPAIDAIFVNGAANVNAAA